jgi:hypothetical protein
MTQLHSFKDTESFCFANIRMDNNDPCYIGVAQTGVIVKKSKLGLLGSKLYESGTVYDAAKTGMSLHQLYPNNLTPQEITNPVLKSFANAVLHCSNLGEVARVLNEAVENAGDI